MGLLYFIVLCKEDGEDFFQEEEQAGSIRQMCMRESTVLNLLILTLSLDSQPGLCPLSKTPPEGDHEIHAKQWQYVPS